MARHHLTQGCEQCTPVYPFHLRYMAQLFPALFPHFPVLRVYLAPWTDMWLGHLYRRKYCCHRSYPQWCRSLALCCKNDAHPLRHSVKRCSLLCTHRPFHTDPLGRPFRHLCLDGISFHEEAGKLKMARNDDTHDSIINTKHLKKNKYYG